MRLHIGIIIIDQVTLYRITQSMSHIEIQKVTGA